MNRKAKMYFSVLLLIFFIIALLPYAMNISNKKITKFSKYIGESQLLLLKTYEKGEKVLFYIDQSSKLILNELLYKYGQAGGLKETSCGSYHGYNRWNSRKKYCLPDIDENLIEDFRTRLYEFFKLYPEMIPNIEYTFLLAPTTEMVGKAQQSLRMDVTSKDKYYFKADVLDFYIEDTPSEVPPGQPPVQPPDDTIKDTACGEALVQIANKGLGHPYCLGSGEWPADRSPPSANECPSQYWTNVHCTIEYWKNRLLQTNKCSIDCSSFTKWVYNFYSNKIRDDKFYIDVRNAKWQAKNIGRPVDHDPTKDWDKWESISPDCSKLQKGDLIFFSRTYAGISVSHVGIYIGDCKIIHAGDPVSVGDLKNEYYRKHYIGAKRVCDDALTGITGGVIQEVNEDQSEYSCSDLNGSICLLNETCSGSSIESEEGMCCLHGNCNYIFAAHELPAEYLPEDQKRLLNLTKEEIKLLKNQTIVDYYDDLDLEEPSIEKPNNAWLFIALGIIILLLFGVFYIKKKKLITISLISILIVSAILVLGLDNKITGYVPLPVEDQKAIVCDIAAKYGIPGNILLTLADKESSINHWDKDGKVKISDDGGIGIMQITGRTSCTSKDGRNLDIYQVAGNVECGATIFLSKCDAFNCYNPSASKEYYCDNSDVPIPPKSVIYKGWDLAIRAWNGWGCMSTYYKELWGVNDPRYADLLKRIQGYVEDFHAREKEFIGVCDNAPPYQPDQPTEAAEIPEEIQTGEKLGFYYLNPSFRVKTEFNLRLYDSLPNDAKKYIDKVRDCTIEEHWLDCVDKYIPNSWDRMECTVTDKYERICNFKVDTGYQALVYDITYEEKPLEIKFSLYFPFKLPNTPLLCEIDKDLDYFTVKDSGSRKYSMCITGDAENVPIHLVEAFETYPGLRLIDYTPLLLMTQCFVESSGGPIGCMQTISGGMCQVECPDEYPNCHDNTDEGRRQNILAAAKLLNNKIGRIYPLRDRYGFSDRDMIKLALFAYNRGEGTILGIPDKRDLNSTTDYLKMGKNLDNAMLHSCYEAYEWNVYGSCGGSKEWCCKTEGGLGYVLGTIAEYESQVCPNTERFVVE